MRIFHIILPLYFFSTIHNLFFCMGFIATTMLNLKILQIQQSRRPDSRKSTCSKYCLRSL